MFINKKLKLSPPSFVTTKCTDRRAVVSQWSTLVMKSKYNSLKELLHLEITILSGYIERKGTQLRLEKALMLTKQIQKVAQRWRVNDFYPQMKLFENSIGIFDDQTGCLAKKDSSYSRRDERLPSSQWVIWVIYLALRDSALLSKITIECENTIKFWLGLISSSHHWGDSLVICGILSRIWFLCSNLMEDFIHIIYPTLLQTSSCLKPNKSSDWPDTKFCPPSNLCEWICHDMKLPFRPMDLSMDVKLSSERKNTKGKVSLSFLTRYFEEDKMEQDEQMQQGSESEKDEVQLVTYSKSKPSRKKRKQFPEQVERRMNDQEDLGMVVERVGQEPLKKKRKLKKKKGK